MKNWKQIAIGLGIALAAITGAAVSFFDDDPKTNPNWGQTIEDVERGIETAFPDATPTPAGVELP